MEIIFELLYELILEGAAEIILAVLALAVLVLIISVFIKPPKKRK